MGGQKYIQKGGHCRCGEGSKIIGTNLQIKNLPGKDINIYCNIIFCPPCYGGDNLLEGGGDADITFDKIHPTMDFKINLH